MTWRYSSPREALRNYFAERKGPRPAKQFWGSRGSTRTYGDASGGAWLDVGVILRGKTENGGCGVEVGSLEELRLRRWAEGIEPTSWLTTRVERALRKALRARGLMAPPQRFTKSESPMVDGSGDRVVVETARIVGGEDE